MLNYEYTTYYTFNEYTSWLDSPSTYPPTSSIRPNVPFLMLAYVSTAYLPPLSFMTLVDGHLVMDDAVVDLLNAMVYRYAEHIAVITRVTQEDVTVMHDAFKDACRSFTINLLSMINLTFPRYKEILSVYASEKAKLLDVVEIQSKSLLRHNDAPQNSGDYSGDAYTSDYTYADAKQQVDHGTPMQRVHEIEISYNNVIKDWLKEFTGLFILEENVI